MRFGRPRRVSALAALVAAGLLVPVVTRTPAAAAVEPYAVQDIVWKPCFEPPQVPSGLPTGAEALE